MKRKAKTTKFPNDPVVDEVRRIRGAMWAEAGGTVEGLLRMIQERAARRAGRKSQSKAKRKGRAA